MDSSSWTEVGDYFESICVYVCVCESKRDRQRDRETEQPSAYRSREMDLWL